MRILHLSDLHIGLKLMNRDLKEDQQHIFGQIAAYAMEKKPDAIVIAGDIYDKATPTIEAVELFDELISMLSEAAPEATIMMISGNHDSASRVNVFRGLLKKQKIYMIGQPPRFEDEYIEKVVLNDEYGEVNFYLLPFVKPSYIKEIVGTDEKGNLLSYNEALHRLIEREAVDCSKRNVLVSHQFYLPVGKTSDDIERMDSEIKTVGNIDEVKADVLHVFDYAALGHIHKPMKVGSEFYRYCGTPLACSVSEAGQQKGVILIEMGEKGNVTTEVLPLKPIREVRIIRDLYQNVLTQPSMDYVTIILTDEEDLDVIDMQDRLRHAFPNLLEIRREVVRSMNYTRTEMTEREMDPFELCLVFLSDLNESEKELLKDVINTVQEVK